MHWNHQPVAHYRNPYEKNTQSESAFFSWWSRPNGLRSFWKSWPWRGSGSEIPPAPRGITDSPPKGWEGGENTNGWPLRCGSFFWDVVSRMLRPKDFFCSNWKFYFLASCKNLKQLHVWKIPTLHFPVCSESCATWQMLIACLRECNPGKMVCFVGDGRVSTLHAFLLLAENWRFMIRFEEHIFSIGLVNQPPTRCSSSNVAGKSILDWKRRWEKISHHRNLTSIRWWQLKEFLMFTPDLWGKLIQFDPYFLRWVGSTTN